VDCTRKSPRALTYGDCFFIAAPNLPARTARHLLTFAAGTDLAQVTTKEDRARRGVKL